MSGLSKAKIAFVLGDQGPSGYYRIILPCQTLKDEGLIADLAFAYDDFAAADILVFQRQHRPGAVDEVMRWQGLGKKIVVDFDDDYLQLDSGNKANLVYTEEVTADLKRLVSAADAITTATKPLAALYGEYNKNVHVIPNALPARAFKLSPRPSKRLIVGWQGSDSHHEDLRLIAGAVGSLQKRFDFKLVLAGYNPLDLFKGATFRTWTPFSPELDYFQAFADFGVGLCPLAKTPFNEGKSDLKWLEYSALAIPAVASAVSAYEELEDGATGLLADSADEWEEQIARLLLDKVLRRKLGEAAREHVLAKRTILGSLTLWRDLFTTI